jgi:predicted P-loop ATPase/GTPase
MIWMLWKTLARLLIIKDLNGITYNFSSYRLALEHNFLLLYIFLNLRIDFYNFFI